MAKKNIVRPMAQSMSFELSRQTLQVCYQALASVPSTNAQQAQVLANALSELETAIQLRQPVAEKEVVVVEE